MIESMIRADTVKVRTHEDARTGDTVITMSAQFEINTRVSWHMLQDTPPEMLLPLSSDIHRNLLMGLRSGVIGGERELIEELHNLRHILTGMHHLMPGMHGMQLWEEAMKAVDSLQSGLLEHPSDGKAFEVNQDAQPTGETNFASTNTGRPRQEHRGHKEIPGVFGGRHESEAEGTAQHASLGHPPGLDAPPGKTPKA